MICAPKIEHKRLPFMQTLIEDYLDMRLACFPDIRLRPKHHFLMHYPQLTAAFGPLIRMWSLRFESKHSYFKQVIRQSHNFVNVAKMLAEKHQLYQSYLSEGERFAKDIECNNPMPFILASYTGEIRTAIANAIDFTADSTCVYFANEAKKNGTSYKSGLVLPLGCNQGKLLVGKILFIILRGKNLFLVMEKHQPVWISSLGLYRIMDESNFNFECMDLENALDSTPLPLYQLGNMLVFPLKHKFTEM